MIPPLPGTPGLHHHHHVEGSMPVGTVIAFAGQVAIPPVDPLKQSVFTTVTEASGWMLCDGRTLTVLEYELLFAVIGNQYNNGKEQSGQFSIPDYRGYFLRMTDMGTGNDPDAAKRVLANGSTSSEVGSIQQDALQTHEHSYQDPATTTIPAGQGSATAVTQMPSQLTGTPTDDLNNPPGTVRTSTETRAKNVYVNYLIRF
jgi:microcystin-dependent protein